MGGYPMAPPHPMYPQQPAPFMNAPLPPPQGQHPPQHVAPPVQPPNGNITAPQGMQPNANGSNSTIAPNASGDGKTEGKEQDKEEKKKKKKPTLLYDNEMVSMEEQRFMNPKY